MADSMESRADMANNLKHSVRYIPILLLGSGLEGDRVQAIEWQNLTPYQWQLVTFAHHVCTRGARDCQRFASSCRVNADGCESTGNWKWRRQGQPPHA